MCALTRQVEDLASDDAFEAGGKVLEPRSGLQPNACRGIIDLDLPRQRVLEVCFGVEDRSCHSETFE